MDEASETSEVINCREHVHVIHIQHILKQVKCMQTSNIQVIAVSSCSEIQTTDLQVEHQQAIPTQESLLYLSKSKFPCPNPGPPHIHFFNL